jgi:hypothetical protein|tara:strand:- start:382 stop:612 length:231 start_codon:yes stop_codon:yes gene_type:complete
MNKAYIRRNIKYISIIIFLVLFYVIVELKPSFIFETDGSVKQFGVGHSKKTVIPLWVVAGSLGILSYMMVLYYIIM